MKSKFKTSCKLKDCDGRHGKIKNKKLTLCNECLIKFREFLGI